MMHMPTSGSKPESGASFGTVLVHYLSYSLRSQLAVAVAVVAVKMIQLFAIENLGLVKHKPKLSFYKLDKIEI